MGTRFCHQWSSKKNYISCNNSNAKFMPYWTFSKYQKRKMFPTYLLLHTMNFTISYNIVWKCTLSDFLCVPRIKPFSAKKIFNCFAVFYIFCCFTTDSLYYLSIITAVPKDNSSFIRQKSQLRVNLRLPHFANIEIKVLYRIDHKASRIV